ncbi:DUF805 domain-containing protein [Caulobacter endophyticus]|uniref:DUF805 domain-containing protein n=1 Tax=Caulobacter endophyticus TaxID=2172652 RepID=UPI0024106D14|nr:DUF805 domain-containing protein [Caulobacter endophyticus]MDG2527381.1 DUF805 domain-containing protein [Caulobacter endophyticus]
MSLMFQPLKKYADFKGRARRSEFWLFTLFIVIVYVVYFAALAVTGGFGNQEPSGAAIGVIAIFSLFFLGIFIPGLAVTFRRLHDINRSAWWILISLIPLGGIVLLVFYCLPGAEGPNQFGPDPKRTSADTAEAFA